MEARKLQTSEIGNDTRSLIYDIRFHDLRFMDNTKLEDETPF